MALISKQGMSMLRWDDHNIGYETIFCAFQPYIENTAETGLEAALGYKWSQ
jgi:hypothetical protein